MERITKRMQDGGYVIVGHEDVDLASTNEAAETLYKVVDAAGRLEDDIENGLYLRLPVPIGEKVYELDGSEWIMAAVYTAAGIGRDAGRVSTFSADAIGRTVFLTKDCDGKKSE